MTRRANRLTVEEIDEVSSVDIPANQHGLIAIAKRAGEATMDEYFDEAGNPVDLGDVEVGERVFDNEGNSFVMASQDDIDDMVQAGELNPDDVVDFDGDEEEEYADSGELVGAVGKRGGLGATVARRGGAPGISGGQRSARSVRRGRSDDLGEPGRGRVRKSAGQQVIEELRAALTEEQRETIIAKAFNRLDTTDSHIRRLESLVERLVDEREDDRYTELAKNFDGVPVDPNELAGILRGVSGTLSKRQLDAFERILVAAGEAGGLDEVGYGGGYASSGALDTIAGYAQEVVAKSGDMSVEQATTALLSANPELYDEYCAGF